MDRKPLADAAGTTAQYVSHLENGIRKNPGYALVEKLAAALGVKPADLEAGGKEPPPPAPIRIARTPDAVVKLPVVGEVPAGRPLSVGDVATEWIDLGEMYREEGLVCYRVRGRSMEEAKIADGDLVVVRPQPEAASGEVVVATIDGELTLKQFVRRRGSWLLVPMNSDSDVPPIELDSVDDPRILGVYVNRVGLPPSVFRRKR